MIFEIENQCCIVNKTDFDFAQSDSYPERSPRLTGRVGKLTAINHNIVESEFIYCRSL
jgi:hypothetical protein